MRRLELTHHYCLKYPKKIQRDKRSDMMKGMFPSIEAYTAKQKLTFFSSFFRTPHTDLAAHLQTDSDTIPCVLLINNKVSFPIYTVL